MGVTPKMVKMKAAHLIREFRQKTQWSQYQQVGRWLKTQRLVLRIATHESQKDPRETIADALDFLELNRSKMIEPFRHQDFLINMDQTPVPFTFHSKKTLEVLGSRTINVRKSTNDTKRASFAMTVTASGKVLKSLLVFKGQGWWMD